MRRQHGKRTRLMLRSWRFWADKAGRIHRTCRCEYCNQVYKRERGIADDWQAVGDDLRDAMGMKR